MKGFTPRTPFAGVTHHNSTPGQPDVAPSWQFVAANVAGLTSIPRRICRVCCGVAGPGEDGYTLTTLNA
jgi:hypothetical protein